MAKNYIRNRDRKKFPVSKLSEHKGVLLSEFKGTIKSAKRKGVPVFDARGHHKRGSIGYHK